MAGVSSVERERVWLQVAAATTGAAGAVHAAVAGQHADHRALAYGFAACAVAQLLWSAAALLRPSRTVAVLGVVLAVGSIAAWAVTRLVAIPAIDGLERVQPVGAQDVVVVAAQLVAAAAAGAALLRLGMRRTFAPAAAVLSLAFAVPALAAPHAHDDPTHDHTAHDEVAHDEVAHDEVAHEEVAHDDGGLPNGGDHPHPSTPAGASAPVGPTSDGGVATTPATVTDPGGHSAAPDRPPTADELARAAELVASTRAALAAYRTTDDAEAAGYRSIGDARTGYEHFVNAALLADGRELDPAHVESLVFRVETDGSKTLVSGMYILETGRTLADVPEVGGPLTVWHDHQNLCWDGNGRVVGLLLNGTCVPRGTFRPTAPMLHVWLVDHPCGPFAGVEGRGPAALLGSHGEGCTDSHG